MNQNKMVFKLHLDIIYFNIGKKFNKKYIKILLMLKAKTQ